MSNFSFPDNNDNFLMALKELQAQEMKAQIAQRQAQPLVDQSSGKFKEYMDLNFRMYYTVVGVIGLVSNGILLAKSLVFFEFLELLPGLFGPPGFLGLQTVARIS